MPLIPSTILPTPIWLCRAALLQSHRWRSGHSEAEGVVGVESDLGGLVVCQVVVPELVLRVWVIVGYGEGSGSSGLCSSVPLHPSRSLI